MKLLFYQNKIEKERQNVNDNSPQRHTENVNLIQDGLSSLSVIQSTNFKSYLGTDVQQQFSIIHDVSNVLLFNVRHLYS